MGERMRIALFSRVLAEHVPVGDVLPAETEEVASADANAGGPRARLLPRLRAPVLGRTIADCGMLDCMSLLLVDVREGGGSATWSLRTRTRRRRDGGTICCSLGSARLSRLWRGGGTICTPSAGVHAC